MSPPLAPPIPADSDLRKTELLLELALRYRGSRNVFFIRAHDAVSLDQAFLELTMSIGHDILAIRHPGIDVHAMWLQLAPSERVNSFRTWLGETENQPSLFIVDDIDGMLDDALIQAALPRDAHCILFSTRDPSIVDSLDRECKELRVNPMDVDEMASLMASVLRRSTNLHIDITEGELEAIAKIVDGHALAACRAISYIIHVLAQTAKSRPADAFLDMITGSNWKARLRFLEYKPRFGHSIMQTFDISLQRLRRHRDDAIPLLELIALLSSKTDSLDFRQFLDIERPWLAIIKEDLPNFTTFEQGMADRSELLAELENVSIGLRPSLSTPLPLHPLWAECILQQAKHVGRFRWLCQVLLLCYESWQRKEFTDIVRRVVLHCVKVAKRFDIGLDLIPGSEELKNWIRHYIELNNENTISEEPKSIASRQSQTPSPDELSKDNETQSEEANNGLLEMRRLLADCKDLKQTVSTQDPRSLTTDTQQSWMGRIYNLLQRFRKQDESKGQIKGAKLQQAHLETYDAFIEVVPLLMVHNPALLDQLKRRRQDFAQQYSLDV